MFGKERVRFVKLLKMTQSSSDGEALVAIRKCNDMLIQQKSNWNDVVVEHCVSQARPGLSEATNGFGEARRNVRPSPSRAFEASLRREEYREQLRRNQKAAAIQVYISKTPILLRLVFLPLWAAAAMLGSVVVPEVRTPVRAVKFFATMLVVAACGAAWLQIFDVVVAFL
jgi:hypothetical protein